MNDRIKLLAEQCGFKSNPNIYDRNQSFDIPKFAELILFECIKIAVFRGDKSTAKAIKEHFEVEP